MIIFLDIWGWPAKAQLSYSKISSRNSAAQDSDFVEKTDDDSNETSKNVENKSIYIFIDDARRTRVFVDEAGIISVQLN